MQQELGRRGQWLYRISHFRWEEDEVDNWNRISKCSIFNKHRKKALLEVSRANIYLIVRIDKNYLSLIWSRFILEMDSARNNATYLFFLLSSLHLLQMKWPHLSTKRVFSAPFSSIWRGKKWQLTHLHIETIELKSLLLNAPNLLEFTRLSERGEIAHVFFDNLSGMSLDDEQL